MRKKIFLSALAFTIMAVSAGCGSRDEDMREMDTNPSGSAAAVGDLTPSNTPVPKAASISMDQATEIAWNDAKVSEDDVQNLRVRLERDKDGSEYEVVFIAGNKAYEYKIAKEDGEILEKGIKAVEQPKATEVPEITKAPEDENVPTKKPQANNEITKDKAVEIARKDAKVSTDSMLHLKVHLDYENGIEVYDVEFDTKDKEYEYKIAVSDGAILKREIDHNGYIEATPTPGSQTAKEITKEQAIEIAKKDADVANDKIINLKVRMDFENGRWEYEVEFDTDKIEYEYKILASDGTIIEKDTDMLNNKQELPEITNGISKEEALKIARNDAGVAEKDITNLSVKLEKDDGRWEYDIEFDAGEKEYEYKILAENGTILEKDIDLLDSWQTIITPETGKITQDAAVAAARKDAGVSKKDITNLSVKLEKDDGRWEYDIEFDAAGKEYDYKIAAADGTVLEKDIKLLDKTTKPQTSKITQDEAVAAARKDAGVSEKDITNLSVKLEKDDGRWEYDIEFDAAGKEYDYKIAAADGAVLEKDIELLDHWQEPEQSGEITQDEALEIARKDAGVAKSDIRKLEVERDFDDGIWIYEIEFKAGRLEYEYEIAASNGKILKKEIDD